MTSGPSQIKLFQLYQPVRRKYHLDASHSQRQRDLAAAGYPTATALDRLSDEGLHAPLPPELEELCLVVASLPGIDPAPRARLTTPHDDGTVSETCLFFEVDPGDQRGLQVLVHCTDYRFWQYGHMWSNSVVLSDTVHGFSDGRAVYTLANHAVWGGKLNIETDRSASHQQMQSLVRQLYYAMHHVDFLEGAGLPPSKWWLARWPKSVRGLAAPSWEWGAGGPAIAPER